VWPYSTLADASNDAKLFPNINLRAVPAAGKFPGKEESVAILYVKLSDRVPGATPAVTWVLWKVLIPELCLHMTLESDAQVVSPALVKPKRAWADGYDTTPKLFP
jgi:hypothetical protein